MADLTDERLVEWVAREMLRHYGIRFHLAKLTAATILALPEIAAALRLAEAYDRYLSAPTGREKERAYNDRVEAVHAYRAAVRETGDE